MTVIHDFQFAMFLLLYSLHLPSEQLLRISYTTGYTLSRGEVSELMSMQPPPHKFSSVVVLLSFRTDYEIVKWPPV